MVIFSYIKSMEEKKFIEIGGYMVEIKDEHQLPEDADQYTRDSYIISGRIKPETEQEEKLVREAKEMMDKGITVEIPFN